MTWLVVHILWILPSISFVTFILFLICNFNVQADCISLGDDNDG